MPTFECPTCRKTIRVDKIQEAPFRPFCCERCKLVDLGRWFDGSYTVSDPLDSTNPDQPDQDES
ncbi:MAG: DNA gyrase inhibitor YacG [Planctomycetes bacterium]|nr:DNA gyrase inhibitor YacG [Planctomycetota bacterium]